MASCNRKALAVEVRKTRALRAKVAPHQRDRFNDLVRAAVVDGKHGYCQAAWVKLGRARQLASRLRGGLGRAGRR